VVLTGIPAGRLADRFGPPLLTTIGLIGIGLGSILLATLPLSLGLPAYLLPIVIITMGYAAFQTSNNTAVLSGVESGQKGLVSGMLNLSRNLGLITGASVMGAVFSAATGGLTAAIPESISRGLHTTFALAAGLVMTAIAIALTTHRCGHPLRPCAAA
jgi:MFS family permease